MERYIRKRISTEFPDREDMASNIQSLYEVARAFFEEIELKPKIIIEGYSSDGSISQIAFENLPKDMAWDLACKIRNERPNAWTHLEALTDNERKNKSWVRLFADTASVRKS